MSSFFGKLKSQVRWRPLGLLRLLRRSHNASARRPASCTWATTDYCVSQNAPSPAVGTTPIKRDPNAPIPTPLERMLKNAGPLRTDGSDKFFGMENVCVHPCFGAGLD